MSRNEMWKKILPYLLMVLIVAIDQIVKWQVLSHHIFSKINPGFLFGLGPNWDLFFWSSCILIIFLFLLAIKKPLRQTYNLLIILAAALSNLIDRIFRGGVVDYFRLSYFHTQVFFNLADIILILGIFIYAFEIGKENQH